MRVPFGPKKSPIDQRKKQPSIRWLLLYKRSIYVLQGEWRLNQRRDRQQCA